MYIKVEDGIAFNYSINQLKADNPNVSFPSDLSEALLNQFSVYKVYLEDMPLLNDSEQIAEQSSNPVFKNGKWVLEFNVRDKTQAEKDQFSFELQNQIRSKRNKLLAETDWMALTDVTMSTEMATYRQALRDITAHANFPNLTETDWPTKPE